MAKTSGGTYDSEQTFMFLEGADTSDDAEDEDEESDRDEDDGRDEGVCVGRDQSELVVLHQQPHTDGSQACGRRLQNVQPVYTPY